MRFHIAHLLWLIAACAVYFGLVRWSSNAAGGWFETWLWPLMIMPVIAICGKFIYSELPAAWKRSNRRASEEFVEQHTSGRNVRIEDRWNT